MKASEWATRFDNATDLGIELGNFIGEIGKIADARGGSVGAVEGAVREQKDKFKAVCSRTSRVNMGLWPTLMKLHGKEYMTDVRTFLQQKAAPKNRHGKSRNKGTKSRSAA